jgi:opacity protein-like surface antigen
MKKVILSLVMAIVSASSAYALDNTQEQGTPSCPLQSKIGRYDVTKSEPKGVLARLGDALEGAR